MKKFLWITGLSVIFYMSIFSQQVPLLTQHMIDKYLYNPAWAGAENRFIFSCAYRNQWTGFEGAPKTTLFYTHGPLSGGNNVGGIIFSDNIGAFSRLGIYPSYAYLVMLDRQLTLHFGLQIGLLQQVINGNELITREPDDPSVPKEPIKTLFFDGSFGTILNSEFFYLGISFPHIIDGVGLLYSDFAQVQSGIVKRHLIAFGGAILPATDKVKIEPSTLLKVTRAAPIQLDVSFRAIMDYGWVGLTYRSRAAVAFMAGFQLKDAFQLGYSLDIATTELQNYSHGSHEFILRFLLKEKRRSSAYFR